MTTRILSLSRSRPSASPATARAARPAARVLRAMGLAIALGAAGCSVGEEVSLRVRRAELESYLAANLRDAEGAARDRRVASNRYHLAWIETGLQERWGLGGHGTLGALGVVVRGAVHRGGALVRRPDAERGRPQREPPASR